MLPTGELSSTLSEALFHYREILTIRENERRDDLPQKGKLPATEDDDIMQQAYNVQLEAVNYLIDRVEDMVGVFATPSEKCIVGLQPQIPAGSQPWAESYYQKDEPFFNPFTGKLVEVPSSSSSGPGPSAREGPLKEISASFWEDFNYNPSPNHSTPLSLPDLRGRDTNQLVHGNADDHTNYPMRDITRLGDNVSHLHSSQVSSSGAKIMARENDFRLPGTYVHSWTIPPDENLANYTTKPIFPTASTLSRTKSKILKAASPWGLGWMPRTHSAPAIQLSEIQEKSQTLPETTKPAASSILKSVSDLYAREGTKDNNNSSFSKIGSTGAKNAGQRGSKGSGGKRRWRTALEQQEVDEEEKGAIHLSSTTTPSDNIRSTELKAPPKDTERVIPIPIPASTIPPVSVNTSKTSPTTTTTTTTTPSPPSSATLSSEVSSTAGADLQGVEGDEGKKLPDFSGHFGSSIDGGVSIHPLQGMEPKSTSRTGSNASETLEQLWKDIKLTKQDSWGEVIGQPAETGLDQQKYGPPNYPPVLQHSDQVTSDGALAERLAVFEAEFQKPLDLFEDEVQESKDLLLQLEQYQKDRELAEQLAMGYDQGFDPETLALIAELADGAPQDYDTLLEQEVANELLIAELSGGICQDFDTVLKIRRQDRELAIKLAEDSPQDLKEHLRQLQAQEEFARKAQETWDEEETERLAEIARQEEREEQERLRRERMATCTACSVEGEKADMAMLSCTHGYCTGCIRLAFQLAMKNKEPFRCCTQVLINSIAKHFTPDFVTEYTWLVLEVTTPNPLYCATKSCSKFIPPNSIHGDIGTCRACANGTCRHCRAPAHAGSICAADTEVAAVRELARQKGWKPCPGCRHMIERTEGCLHMTCIKCRTEFCYSCGQLSSACSGVCKR